MITETGNAALSAFVRAAGLAALVFGAVLVFMFAAAAAVVIGLMVAGAAIALRLAPKRAHAQNDMQSDILDARHTPAGWVVETARRKS
jgi:hypothetical protein